MLSNLMKEESDGTNVTEKTYKSPAFLTLAALARSEETHAVAPC